MGAAAAIILRKERDIVSAYRGAGATSPDRARSPEELDVDQRLPFERLVQRAVLRRVGDGRYYLDEPSWEALRGIRQRMALVMMLLVVGALVILIASGVVTFGGAPRS
jgi:hypothetical protein